MIYTYRKYIYILVGIILLTSCSLFRKSIMITDARDWKYKFNSEDKLYIQSFENQDDSLLKRNFVTFKLTQDSLIIDKGLIGAKDTIYKYYKDHFEISYYACFKSKCYYWYSYTYSGDLIKMKDYMYNEVQSERTNVNGKVYLKMIQIIMPDF